MRFIRQFLLWALLSLVLACALSYPLFSVLVPYLPTLRFDRLATRVFQLLIVIGSVWLVRRHGLTHKHYFGLAVPKATLWRQLRVGFGLGVVSLLPAALLLLYLDIRTLAPFSTPLAYLNWLLAAGLTGWVVGALEELLFRGLLQSVLVANQTRVWPGLILLSLLFAAVHFLARTPITAAEVTPLSGYLLWQSIFVKFGQPSRIIDAFSALFFVALILVQLTRRSGSIGLAIGAHAGWVFIIKLTVGISQLNTHSPYRFWVNGDDGFVGWLVALSGALCLGLLLGEPTPLMRYLYPERFAPADPRTD
jgi:uncharacterized protein